MQVDFKNNKIAEFRESQHMSQRRLAKEIGTSQANLSRWEKGIIEPSIIMCWCLADYFAVSIDVLCGRTEYLSAFTLIALLLNYIRAYAR